MTANEEPGPWVESWLSGPRFGVYLAAAGTDRRLALVLYEACDEDWNRILSARRSFRIWVWFVGVGGRSSVVGWWFGSGRRG